MAQLEFCPECGIGINSQEKQLGFCQNCKAHWDADDYEIDVDAEAERCPHCDTPLDNNGATSRGDGYIYDEIYCPLCGEVIEERHATNCPCPDCDPYGLNADYDDDEFDSIDPAFTWHSDPFAEDSDNDYTPQ